MAAAASSETEPRSGLPDGNGEESSKKEKPNKLEKTALLQELFVKELLDLLWAEEHLLKLWQDLRQTVSDNTLNTILGGWLTRAVIHTQRLRNIFEQQLGLEIALQKCQGMAGLLAEADLLIEQTRQITDVRDIAIVMIMQKINYYKISSYKAMAAFAEMRSQDQIKRLLTENLQEEEEVGKNLADLFVDLTRQLELE